MGGWWGISGFGFMPKDLEHGGFRWDVDYHLGLIIIALTGEGIFGLKSQVIDQAAARRLCI